MGAVLSLASSRPAAVFGCELDGEREATYISVMSAPIRGREEWARMLRPRRKRRHWSGVRHGGLKMPKGLMKIMLMGSIGLFFGAAIAGYIFSM
jgi:hypothetical protein